MNELVQHHTRIPGAMTYAGGRIAWFSMELLTAWVVLGLISAAGVLLLQPQSWTAAGSGSTARAEQQWRSSFSADGYDLRSLPRVSSLISQPETHLSFADAVEIADTIVVGSVLTLNFDDPYVTRVTFAVEHTLKGAAGRQLLEYRTAGGPVPMHESQRYIAGQGFLYEEPWAPYLFSGERAVLFLTEAGEQVWPLPGGVYRVSFGRIQMPDNGMISGEVHGLKLDELVQRIQFVLAFDRQPS